MNQRKKIGAVAIIVIGLIIGYFLKNVKEGLILGLILGLLASGLLRNTR